MFNILCKQTKTATFSMIYADQKYSLEVEDKILYFIYNQLKLALQKKEKKYPQTFIEQNNYLHYVSCFNIDHCQLVYFRGSSKIL